MTWAWGSSVFGVRLQRTALATPITYLRKEEDGVSTNPPLRPYNSLGTVTWFQLYEKNLCCPTAYDP